MLYQSKNLSLELLSSGISRLNFDKQNGGVNLFDVQTINDFSEALACLQQTDGVKGLLISSAKNVFIVGADVGFLESACGSDDRAVADFLASNNANLNRLEDLPFPVVVAINGAAVGGGYELCLAADYRVMSQSALVGLPETTLGILPGWGGTVRLPRLIPLSDALDCIISGKNQRADKALSLGAVDEVVAPDALDTKALAVLQECIDGKRDYLTYRAKKTSPLALSAEQLAAIIDPLKAKLANNPVVSIKLAVEAVEKGAGLSREGALAAEKEAIMTALTSATATALLGNFVSDQRLSRGAQAWAKRQDKPVAQAAVLGAGIMGGGIAYQSALKGFPTLMKDIAQEGLDAGMAEAESLLSRRVKRGQMAETKKTQILATIQPALEYDGFDAVDMVVEAVVENPKIKHFVLAEVEQQVSEDTVIASNTSTISISYLAEAMQRPENFCGMHFFNPVHAMPLVEVIRGEKTSDAAVARTVAYATAIGKKAIVVNDCPGFLVNRALFPYFAGFSKLLRDGADFQQVDRVMEQWGWPMGPAYLADVIGIDTLDHCEAVMAEGFPDRMSKPNPMSLDILASAGCYGQKSGQGFYQYSKDENGRPVKAAAAEAYSLLEPYCADRRDFSDEEIVARMMVPMATEMARILDDGIVEHAYEADLGLLYGLGFPAFRGGVLRWMDNIGLPAVCDMADEHAELGKLYEPTESMRSMAQQGKGYYA